MHKLKTIEKTSAAKTWLQSHESDKANVSKTELTERSVLKIEKQISMEWIFHLEDINKTFSKQQLFVIK